MPNWKVWEMKVPLLKVALLKTSPYLYNSTSLLTEIY